MGQRVGPDIIGLGPQSLLTYVKGARLSSSPWRDSLSFAFLPPSCSQPTPATMPNCTLSLPRGCWMDVGGGGVSR